MTKCITCRDGDMHPGTVTTTLHRNDHVTVFKHVPANVCDTCGDHTFSMDVVEQMIELATQAEASGLELGVADFRVAA